MYGSSSSPIVNARVFKTLPESSFSCSNVWLWSWQFLDKTSQLIWNSHIRRRFVCFIRQISVLSRCKFCSQSDAPPSPNRKFVLVAKGKSVFSQESGWDSLVNYFQWLNHFSLILLQYIRWEVCISSKNEILRKL